MSAQRRKPSARSLVGRVWDRIGTRTVQVCALSVLLFGATSAGVRSPADADKAVHMPDDRDQPTPMATTWVDKPREDIPQATPEGGPRQPGAVAVAGVRSADGRDSGGSVAVKEEQTVPQAANGGSAPLVTVAAADREAVSQIWNDTVREDIPQATAQP